MRGGEGAEGARAHLAPPDFSKKKIVHKQKMQKHNINKIYQIELRSKEMTCLIIIAETKDTFSAFKLSH